ncbi:MAG TPA: sigma-70 family RNA polymerase sigma factor [Polyangiaceae bacterium]|jgi:RNA polymerase sigma-70 factor (ECF subfamily)|nr:sigma-70 family RNA polymerase sigma factor [Polyangiaceae bacterium]
MTVERIYELYADFVFRTLRALGMPARDVADAMQEVFLAVHRTLPGFEARCSMKTWLFTICRSVARDRRRRAHERYEVIDAALVSQEPDERADMGARLEHRQRLAELDAILANMEEEQRLVFVLFEIESMTGSEISEALGIPLGTAYSRLRLARAVFRAAVARRRAAEQTPFLRVASKP